MANRSYWIRSHNHREPKFKRHSIMWVVHPHQVPWREVQLTFGETTACQCFLCVIRYREVHDCFHSWGSKPCRWCWHHIFPGTTEKFRHSEDHLCVTWMYPKCSSGIRGNGRQGTGCACHRQNNNNCLLWLLVDLFKRRVSHVAGVTCDNPVISMCFSGPARPPCGIVLPHHWGSWIEQAVFAVESTNAWPDLRLHCHKSKSVTFWRCTGKAVESDAHHSNEKRSRRTAATAAATRRATATGTAASTNAVRNSWNASIGRRYGFFLWNKDTLKASNMVSTKTARASTENMNCWKYRVCSERIHAIYMFIGMHQPLSDRFSTIWRCTPWPSRCGRKRAPNPEPP